jgi:predicted TIM-barrel fold metal-dependent hydrolase
MGHSGYGEWEVSVGAARDLPNVFLELTAVYAADNFALLSFCPEWRARASVPGISGIIEYMVEQAGSHKIVFGTDLPWYSPHYAAGSILFAHISDEDRHNILHRNAEKLLARFAPATRD